MSLTAHQKNTIEMVSADDSVVACFYIKQNKNGYDGLGPGPMALDPIWVKEACI